MYVYEWFEVRSTVGNTATDKWPAIRRGVSQLVFVAERRPCVTVTKRQVTNRHGERNPNEQALFILAGLFRPSISNDVRINWVKAASSRSLARSRLPNTKRGPNERMYVRLFVPYRWRNENLFFLFPRLGSARLGSAGLCRFRHRERWNATRWWRTRENGWRVF